MNAIVNFILYFVASLGLMAVFMVAYEKFTPYKEWEEIKKGNAAAAIAFGGAILGFVFPLASAIFFTHSLLEMVKWALIVGVVQLAVFEVIHRIHGFGDCVKDGRVAGATFLAFCSIAVGIINAVSISY